MSTRDSTHVRVKNDTKNNLEELGTAGDSFDDVISRLIESHEQ